MTEQVKNFLKQNDPDVTDERVAALLEKAGFTDAYIAEQTDKIFDAVYEDGATVDSVSQKAADTVEEVFKKLEESGESEFAGAALSEENKAEIKTTFSDALTAVAGEDGTLDAENLVSNLLLQFCAFPNRKRRLPFRGDAFVGKGSRFGGFRSRGGRRGGA